VVENIFNFFFRFMLQQEIVTSRDVLTFQLFFPRVCWCHNFKFDWLVISFHYCDD